MGTVVNSIPVISQLKSFGQVITGDAAGARQTQEDFASTAPGVSQITSLVQAIQGDNDAARRTQERFLGNAIAAARLALLPLGWMLGMPIARRPISTRLTPRPRWMDNPAVQSQCIHELRLPGTHDSATYRFKSYLPVANDFAQAQNQSIRQQLDGGIRALDLRFRRDGDTIYCAHTYLTVPLSEVLNDLRGFIEQNPTEKVVVNTDWDVDGSKDWHLLRDAWDAANVVLSGRLVRRTSLNKPIALWGREAVLWLLKGELEARPVINNSYGDTKSSTPEEAVDKCVAWAARSERKIGSLNLLACQATPGNDIAQTIQNVLSETKLGLAGLAERANAQIAGALFSNGAACFNANIVNMDYADDGLIEQIIRLNPTDLATAGYKVVSEGAQVTLSAYTYAAYGADTRFAYGVFAPGGLTFNNGTFSDPAFGTPKSGYYRSASLIPNLPFKWPDHQDIFLMVGTLAWWVVSPETFTAMKLPPHLVLENATKPSVLLAGNFQDRPFRGSGNRGAWLIAETGAVNNNRRRWRVRDAATLRGCAMAWDSMTVVPDVIFDASPAGSGDFEDQPFKKRSDDRCYAMRDGRKCHIASLGVLARLFPGKDVLVVADWIVDRLPEGGELT